MDPRALELLELPEILDRLAGVAGSEPGRLQALALRPSADPDEVAARQALTTEAVAILEQSAEPDLAGARDVRPAVEVAARGSVLDTGALHTIAVSIDTGVTARIALESVDDVPGLARLASRIDPGLRAMAGMIGERVEADGSDLKDGASSEAQPPAPAAPRGEGPGRRRGTRRLARRRTGCASTSRRTSSPQRGGRPVLAVKASRSAVPGVVHDASRPGRDAVRRAVRVGQAPATAQSEAAGAEREEVERILRELTTAVGELAVQIEAAVVATAEIDLALACGIVSRRWRGAPVEPSAEVSLADARHPLLDPASTVPIDLKGFGDLRALVISGPNTGGKTVALKTLGLAAKPFTGRAPPAGLPRRAARVRRGIADIGDPQSIEMSLSTFWGTSGRSWPSWAPPPSGRSS